MQPDSRRQRRMVARTALVGVILLCAVPFTAPFAAWVLPAPMMAVTTRERWPAAVAACTALLVGGFGWNALIFALAAWFVGWVAGDAIRRKESLYVPLIAGALTFIMLELVQLAFIQAHGLDIGQQITRWVSRMWSDWAHALDGLDAQRTSDALAARIRLMLPASLCIIAVILSALNLTAGRLLLGRIGEGAPSLLAGWRLPMEVAAVYMLSLPLLWFRSFETTSVWWQCVNTIAVVAGFLIAIQGMSCVWRRIKPEHWRWAWLVLIAGIVPLIPYGANLYVLLGLVDMLSGLRRQ
ncbi:MAG: DUF2232 domain-containing protein [Alicyclobacillaceae bacterium]|nr:DUF2232 domain-containing protein [Alicyclobacillaceae bacterium]